MKIKLSKNLITILILIIPFVCVNAQQKEITVNKLSGNIFLDSKLAAANYQVQPPQLKFQNEEKKSRWLAGAMSLVLPGAGEFYAGDYLKAGIFFVVEAAAITTAIIYTNKGNSKTQDFQNYANQEWSISKYAAWTLQHVNDINASANITPDDYKVFNNNVDWKSLNNNSNWSQLNSEVNRSELNRLEIDLGDGYSHQLPPSGEQQYYELIGKYPQYSHGWLNANFDDHDFHILTNQFLWYAHQRGLANDYYTTGNTAIIFIYVNHVLSTLDAIWSVDKYNSSIAMKFRLNPINTADGIHVMPTLNLSYNF